MRDFTICIGTTFVFGRDAETKVGDELGAKGVSRVLIHHDGGAYLETSGLQPWTGRHFLYGAWRREAESPTDAGA